LILALKLNLDGFLDLILVWKLIISCVGKLF